MFIQLLRRVGTFQVSRNSTTTSSLSNNTRLFSTTLTRPQQQHQQPSRYVPQLTQYHPITHYSTQPLKKTTTITTLFGAAGTFQDPSRPTEDELLRQANMVPEHDYIANTQQRAICTQLIEKYGLHSDETKEFALTTSDLSPNDEIRMLAPCGIPYTNSIYYSVLYHRFGLEEADQFAREHGLEYEKCLVSRAAEELTFWNKAREITQMHAGFVQSAFDNKMRRDEDDARLAKQKEIEQTRREADDLASIAKNRVE